MYNTLNQIAVFLYENLVSNDNISKAKISKMCS